MRTGVRRNTVDILDGRSSERAHVRGFATDEVSRTGDQRNVATASVAADNRQELGRRRENRRLPVPGR